MTRYQETNKKDWIRTFVYIAVFVITLIIGAIFLLPTYWYVWLILVGGGLFLLAGWHANRFAYRCAHCGNEFEISILTDLISPHGINVEGGWKYLRCPQCRQRTKAAILRK